MVEDETATETAALTNSYRALQDKKSSLLKEREKNKIQVQDVSKLDNDLLAFIDIQIFRDNG